MSPDLDRRHLESKEVRAEQTRYSVPGWGEGDLWTRGGVVLAHEFAFSARPPKGAHGPPTGTVPGESERMGNGFVPKVHQLRRQAGPLDPDELAARLAAFLAGDNISFDDVELDLDESTPFQHAVATTLRAVPRGDVVSYGELAALAGYPGAARAAGTFCAHNRFMFLIPCHRVVGATGLGGYGSAGLGVKRRLLALEGVVL